MDFPRLLVAVEVVPLNFQVCEDIVDLFTAVKVGAVVVDIGEVRVNPDSVPSTIECHIGVEMHLGLADADRAPTVGVLLACGEIAENV